MNNELADLYAADRREHNPQTAPPQTYEELRERDRKRRERVAEMIGCPCRWRRSLPDFVQNQERSANDYTEAFGSSP
jgi:hypothetical protein